MTGDDQTQSEHGNGPESGGEWEDEVPLPAEELVPSEEAEEEETRQSEVEVLQKEIVLLEGQLHDMRDHYLRAMADLDNLRKRSRREIRDVQRRAAGAVLTDVLSIVDSFDRALQGARALESAPAETRAVYDGLSLIYRQLMDMLSRRGVTQIQAVGERFDPELHEAVAQVPVGREQEEGRVALEVQRGYKHGDEVLRPSRVGVTVHSKETS